MVSISKCVLYFQHYFFIFNSFYPQIEQLIHLFSPIIAYVFFYFKILVASIITSSPFLHVSIYSFYSLFFHCLVCLFIHFLLIIWMLLFDILFRFINICLFIYLFFMVSLAVGSLFFYNFPGNRIEPSSLTIIPIRFKNTRNRFHKNCNTRLYGCTIGWKVFDTVGIWQCANWLRWN